MGSQHMLNTIKCKFVPFLHLATKFTLYEMNGPAYAILHELFIERLSNHRRCMFKPFITVPYMITRMLSFFKYNNSII